MGVSILNSDFNNFKIFCVYVFSVGFEGNVGAAEMRNRFYRNYI